MARPFRFTFILVLATLGTGLAAVGGWRYARASAPVNGPIILISIDTLRADHLPAYGYQKIKTPAIDALAADGTVFERAYSHSPQTLPAHVSLLSGRLPFETGVRDDVGFVVKAGERLLPQMLRERGYTTAGIVSTHTLRKETGIGEGFDFFDSDIPQSSAEPAPRRDGTESEAIAERWLDQQTSPRVFLFLHLYEPHAPYAPPPEYADYGPYDGEIAYADEIVGRLIRYLKSHQLYDRSTIVLLSDHGEGLGDHGELGHGLFVYDEDIRVPLIVKQAGGLGGGRRVGDVVQHVDLVPTILDLAKARTPGNLRGRSLKAAFEGTSRLSAQAVYSEALYARYHFGWAGLTALTTDRFRYISAPREELYDLARDPRERDNLAAINAKDRGVLSRVLDKLGARSPNDEGLSDPKDKREVVERYRTAVDLAERRRWAPAIVLLRKIVKEDPELAEVWNELGAIAFRMGRFEVAVNAYKHVARLRPADPSGSMGTSEALLKLGRFDEARGEARRAVEIGEASPRRDPQSATATRELLARIALARHDGDAAREEAETARQIDANSPLPAYVEGRLLYDQGQHEDALPLFEEATSAITKGGGPQLAELHFYAADTLSKLGRVLDAEAEFAEELIHFPHNTRARAGLAMLYHTTGRFDEAEQAVTDLIEITPTPDSYTIAARLLTAFGKRRQAEIVRAEALRADGRPPR